MTHTPLLQTAQSIQMRDPLVRAGSTGLTGFFRYHGIWAPGVRLFRKIQFKTKALTLSTMFMLPIAALSWQYFTDKSAAIDFVQQERQGVSALRLALPIYRGLIETQGAARIQASGFDAVALHAQARQQTSQALHALAAQLRQDGDPLQLTPALTALQKAWQATEAHADGLDAQKHTVHGPAIDAAQTLIAQIGDNSGLVLDPDIDSFYLINALVLCLPRALDDLGQLWGWGTYSAVRVGIGTENERRWHVWDASLLQRIEDSRRFVARAIKANAELAARVDIKALDPALGLRRTGELIVFGEGGVRPDDYHRQGQQALSQMFLLYDKALPALDKLLQAREAHLAGARTVTEIILALCLLTAGYLFLSFRKVLEGGIREVSFHINAMRDGNLTTQPRAWGADEVAGLMHTISDMQGSLRHIVVEMRAASDHIVHASSEIAAGSTDLSARTESSASSLQKSATAMAQIAATVRDTADIATEASNMAASNAQVAEKGGQIIGSMVSTMEDIHASSRRISDIISTIDGIAFQTNILALNAAVEAARAGDAGRGFAVVAAEVRALAQRASTAAREIKGLISDSVDKVEAGATIVKDAGSTIHDIVAQARQINDMLASIALSARQEAGEVRETTEAIHAMDAATQQNASLVEQTAAAAAALKDQANSLANEVSAFKLA